MKSYFDEVAAQWERMRESFYSDRVRERAISAARVRHGMIAADIGAGTGFMTEGLLRRGLKVIAVDESKKMLAELKKKLRGRGSIECRRGAAEMIPVGDRRVEYAFANMLLHHVEDPPKAIREMARILKPQGVVVITDLDRHTFDFLRTEHHDRWMGFDRRTVIDWLSQAGLTGLATESVGENCCAKSKDGDEVASIGIFVASGKKET